MALSLVPTSVLAAPDDLGQVHVIVENTTFTEPVNGKAPAWTGTLVDSWVKLTEKSTMMSCVVKALEAKGYTQTGAENNYISDINGLAAFDGGGQSGWMGTLNDWFANEGFGAFTVAAGKLEGGDEIRVDHVELDEGAWVSREELRATYEDTGVSLTGEMIAQFIEGKNP